MATKANLTSVEGLEAYLSSHSIQYTNITLLTGGTANYVYRVTLASGQTVVYKHAAPYLHSNTNFAFDPSRMNYESWALESLPNLLSQQLKNSAPVVNVHPVQWHGYDEEERLLYISDGGPRNLKDAYTDASLDIVKIGDGIGTWIAALHKCSTEATFNVVASKKLERNNPVAVGIYRHSYRNLASALKDYGYGAALGERINDEFGSLLATDDECVCHGDFWPGNVLVKFDQQDRNNAIDLSIADWEMVRRGTSATDVGQFAAESFLLDRFRGGRGLLRAFLTAFVRAREEGEVKIGKEWVKRMAVHWAVHVAFWPTRVEWTDREGTKGLVEIGVGVLRASLDEEWDAVMESELFKETREMWRKVLERA